MSAHTTQTELKLIGKLILEGEMRCETGLHVGAGKDRWRSADPITRGQGRVRPALRAGQLPARQNRSLLEQTSGLAVPAELVYLSRRKGQEVRITRATSRRRNCLLFAAIRAAWSACRARRSRPPRHAGAPRGVRRASTPRASRRRCARTWTTSSRSEERERHRPHHLAGQPAHLERVPSGARFKTRL